MKLLRRSITFCLCAFLFMVLSKPAPAIAAEAAESTVLTDISLATISDIPDQTYSGTAISPALTVTCDNGAAVLVQGTDYDVSYSENTEVGTASVTITGMGTYTGSVVKTFTIVPQAPVFSKLKAYCNGFKATWKKSQNSPPATSFNTRQTNLLTMAVRSQRPLRIRPRLPCPVWSPIRKKRITCVCVHTKRWTASGTFQHGVMSKASKPEESLPKTETNITNIPMVRMQKTNL